jgi:hypothetical protein
MWRREAGKRNFFALDPNQSGFQVGFGVNFR